VKSGLRLFVPSAWSFRFRLHDCDSKSFR
jgi:hypothetical protein